uniref:Large ribosomal subunit protein uL23c n=4 Tax=Cephalotaxus TaxID=50178 RepID=A0A2P1AER9_9CONI|nr:ribosomal protein L23 [Cephalotaxus sinensis]YP_009641709.1 ribosomal protein L23 [Cephalotaxus hainanensis]YP_010138117.1 ribosomal protein L23 [Cephalotaxus griffithii]YP_010138363.1 ribosomal protein L23 [Cephalotaxus harringtonia var. nana]UPV70145.1 ribosomal protein L23 [Cephalotaxus fortunei]UPV71539.1 ribosomal protein L23 [Cephalotaxus fortunei var. alpina]AVI15522.1 ribosomal protein L23 [Cephalotaxus sinensis]AXI98122.1 ribosomal protein L23 [Cephalotaxus sinensis]QBZ37802.1 r
MDEVQYLNLVLTKKSISLFEINQYILNVDSGSTKTKIKSWIELFFNVKVIGVNSYRPPQKREKRGKIQQIMKRYKRMIITLKPGYSIPLFPY